MPFIDDAVVGCGKEAADVVLQDGYWYTPWADEWEPIPDYPGNSGWSGASCALAGRVFGGLGAVILPSWSYHNDWWELVKVSPVPVPDLHAGDAEVSWVHPNPALAGFAVACHAPVDAGTAPDITILDALGREVANLRIAGPITHGRAPAVAGTYILRYMENGRTVAWSRLLVH
jgi:hypothetical protein